MSAYSDLITGTANLVAYWRLGEASGTSAADSSGNGRTGTYVGSPTLGVTGAIIADADKATLLNGSSQYVDCGTAAAIDTGDRTIEMWIKATSLGRHPCGLLDREYDDGWNYGGWALWLNGAGKLWWWNHAGKDLTDSGPLSVPAGAWTHIAAAWDSGTKTVSFYVNGALSGTRTDATIVEKAARAGTDPLQIGNLRNNLAGGGYTFPGAIDDVAIYSRVLAGTEIGQRYTLGIAPAFQPFRAINSSSVAA